MYDGGGHTIIPETTGEGTDFSQYTILESVSPVTLRRSHFDFIDDESGNTRTYRYINPYIHAIHHKDEKGYPNAYNVTDCVIVNGAARPYRGDRSVYSSNNEVLINIKDSSATKCFVQRCTYDADTDAFTASNEDPVVISFSAGTKQIEIDKELLMDGFYGVYTNTDSTMEFFEYRTAPVASYNMSDENFVFKAGDDENLLKGPWDNKTSSGVTYDWEGDSCHLTGTLVNSSFQDLLVSVDAMPEGFVPGQTYTASFGGEIALLRVYYYTADKSDMQLLKNVRTTESFVIPNDAIGIRVRIQITSDNKGKTLDEVVTPVITRSVKPWYSVWWQDDVPSGITEIIPYVDDGDYSGYRKVYNPNKAQGVMFFKGVLGAYSAPLIFKNDM